MDVVGFPTMGRSMVTVNPSVRYSSADLTVLVPTFNRPSKLTRLFISLEEQTQRVGRIIVVDGAENAEEVARVFAKRLPVEYFRCVPPSQIRQRNHGLAQLRPRDRLIVLLDDDMVLKPDAIEQMVLFWNSAEPETAGVCFNIVNGKPERRSILGRLLGLTAKDAGRVLKSGQTTAVSHVGASTLVQWLPGGATIWRKDVLMENPHREISSRWAIAEDLIFSYPIGKRLPLYVCARARARHEHVYDQRPGRQHWYHGRTQTLWLYHFVSSNRDLSKVLFFWTLALRMAGKLLRASVTLDANSLEFVCGQTAAVLAIVCNSVQRGTSHDLLHEPREADATAAKDNASRK
jgi:glycosyltransferase involved in cell wall biosynthesis